MSFVAEQKKSGKAGCHSSGFDMLKFKSTVRMANFVNQSGSTTDGARPWANWTSEPRSSLWKSNSLRTLQAARRANSAISQVIVPRGPAHVRIAWTAWVRKEPGCRDPAHSIWTVSTSVPLCFTTQTKTQLYRSSKASRAAPQWIWVKKQIQRGVVFKAKNEKIRWVLHFQDWAVSSQMKESRI